MNDLPVVVADIDGTVALRHNRGPYDESLVGEDLPNAPIIACIRALVQAGNEVVFVTGRRESARMQTAIWLREHVLRDFALYMRSEHDIRQDATVKSEFVDEILRTREILVVFDDRDATVAMWRSRGLTCLQVAAGNF
jgi:hydroxymethylpyrimidine pyrophosphatase-like HAD family hydrolase